MIANIADLLAGTPQQLAHAQSDGDELPVSFADVLSSIDVDSALSLVQPVATTDVPEVALDPATETDAEIDSDVTVGQHESLTIPLNPADSVDPIIVLTSRDQPEQPVIESVPATAPVVNSPERVNVVVTDSDSALISDSRPVVATDRPHHLIADGPDRSISAATSTVNLSPSRAATLGTIDESIFGITAAVPTKSTSKLVPPTVNPTDVEVIPHPNAKIDLLSTHEAEPTVSVKQESEEVIEAIERPRTDAATSGIAEANSDRTFDAYGPSNLNRGLDSGSDQIFVTAADANGRPPVQPSSIKLPAQNPDVSGLNIEPSAADQHSVVEVDSPDVDDLQIVQTEPTEVAENGFDQVAKADAPARTLSQAVAHRAQHDETRYSQIDDDMASASADVDAVDAVEQEIIADSTDNQFDPGRRHSPAAAAHWYDTNRQHLDVNTAVELTPSVAALADGPIDVAANVPRTDLDSGAAIANVRAAGALHGADAVPASQPLDVTQQVAAAMEQIIETSETPFARSVSLELQPAELGQLRIHVEQTAEAVTAHIIASESVSSELLLSQKDLLLESLADLGFENASVDISHEEHEPSESKQESKKDDAKRSVTSNTADSDASQLRGSGSSGLNIVV